MGSENVRAGFIKLGGVWYNIDYIRDYSPYKETKVKLTLSSASPPRVVDINENEFKKMIEEAIRLKGKIMNG